MKKELGLSTPRLLLRMLDESWAREVLAYFDRNRAFLEPWEPSRPEGFYTRKAQAEHLAADLTAMDAGQMVRLWIFRAEEPETVIGSVALNNIVRGCFLSCQMGYRLDAELTGHGYMTEAAGCLTDFAFDTLGLHRVEANIIPRNIASLRVAEKIGFQNEGVSPKYLKINGRWEDHIHMVKRNTALE
jgi:ribosomal-protein-alanine N-acetyltransferase